MESRNLRLEYISLEVYPLKKGLRVIDSKLERPAKFGVDVIWQNKVIKHFSNCSDVMGLEVHGKGSFGIGPLNKPGNTGRG